MRKLVLSLVALAAVGFVLPYTAPAKAENTVVIHRGDRDRDMRMHRHHNKVIIIKKDHHDHGDRM